MTFDLKRLEELHEHLAVITEILYDIKLDVNYVLALEQENYDLINGNLSTKDASLAINTQQKELKPKQIQLLHLLLAGSSVFDAAKAVGVAEKTAHAWRKQLLFQQVYKQALLEQENKLYGKSEEIQ